MEVIHVDVLSDRKGIAKLSNDDSYFLNRCPNDEQAAEFCPQILLGCVVCRTLQYAFAPLNDLALET